MKEFIRSITKVTVAFVLILLLTGCGSSGNISRSSNSDGTLPVAGPIIVVTDTTENDIEPDTSTEIEEQTTEIIESTKESEPEASSEVPETSPVEETTPEETPAESSEVPETEQSTEPETEPEIVQPEPQYTFKEMGVHMYITASVNIRTAPSVDGEALFVYHMNDMVYVTGQCNETGWYRIDIEGQTLYVSNRYVSTEKVVPPPTTPVVHTTTPQRPTYSTGSFVYYTVAGQHPERSYEEYLYGCLVDRGIAWWYPYAVAQIWQESRWNPNSNNGVDFGICQFNGATFSARAAHHASFPNADVWNPYDSLYVYSFYIRDILLACNNDVDAALSFYIVGHWNQRHDSYINAVMRWYNALGK